MADLTIGRFDKRVTLRSVTKTADGAGGYTEVFTDLLTTWAMVKDRGGNRFFDNGQDGVINKKDIYIYFRTDLMEDLTTDTRIIYDGKDYGIDRTSIVDEVKRILKIEAVSED